MLSLSESWLSVPCGVDSDASEAPADTSYHIIAAEIDYSNSRSTLAAVEVDTVAFLLSVAIDLRPQEASREV